MSAGIRYDWVQPNMDDSTHSFMVFSPRLVFRTAFVTHEQIMLQYQYYTYGDWYNNNPSISLPYPYGQVGISGRLRGLTSTPLPSLPACGGSPTMRAVLPALLLPLAVGCVPIGARTAPPGRAPESSDSQSNLVRPAKIEDVPPAAVLVNQVGYFPVW